MAFDHVDGGPAGADPNSGGGMRTVVRCQNVQRGLTNYPGAIAPKSDLSRNGVRLHSAG